MDYPFSARMNPRLVVVIAVLFVSFSAIFVRLADAPALAIATYRMAFSTLLLLPVLAVQDRRSGNRSDRDAPIRGIGIGDLLLCLLSGLFLALHFATWITSLSYTSIASSTVIVNMQPLFVLLGGRLLLRERSSPSVVLYVGIAIAGCALLSFGDSRVGGHALFGDFLAFLGALSVSGYLIIGRVVRQRLSTRLYTTIVYGASALALLAADLVLRVPLGPYPLRDWLLFLALALFCTLLGHSLLNWSLHALRASFVATAVLGEPVLATLLAILIFGELPEPLAVIGGAIAIGGLALFARAEARESEVSIGRST